MSRILITGSSDGLGALAAQALIQRGHSVYLHARNAQRAQEASRLTPGAAGTLIGDLSLLTSVKEVAAQANATGRFDVVVHNAGVYHGGFRRTSEGMPTLMVVNVLAAYVLTALMERPGRLVFLSSGMHYSGDAAGVADLMYKERGESAWNDTQAYSTSKMCDVLLAKAVARRWADVRSNAMDPGWVATKMGGKSAPGDPAQAVKTYVHLAELEEGSGDYWKPGAVKATALEACESAERQEELLKVCEELTGVKLPE